MAPWFMTTSLPAKLTVTYDLKTRGHDTNFHGNGLSSPAVGRDGAVYVVAEDGTVRKYGGTQ
jgi:hypothetical protein